MSLNVIVASSPPRWPCTPDCVCLAGGGGGSGGDDVTKSGGGEGELCVRSTEVGHLAASRLASVTRLSISGAPPPPPPTARHLSNVRRLRIIAGGVATEQDWSRLFSAAFFRRLDELTIRNGSSAAAAAAATLPNGRFAPSLRRLDISASGVGAVDFGSLSSLRNLKVLDVSDNSLSRLTAKTDAGCIYHSEDDVTSVSAVNFTPGLPSSTAETAAERCQRSNESSHRASSLRLFNASRNQIDEIDVGLFDRKSGRKLELLDLSFNRLSRIDNGTFVDLFALRCVNLSHNIIADVDVDAFTMTSDDEQFDSDDDDVGYQTAGKHREEQYYISLASCTRGWLSIQVTTMLLSLLLLLLTLRISHAQWLMCLVFRH